MKPPLPGGNLRTLLRRTYLGRCPVFVKQQMARARDGEPGAQGRTRKSRNRDGTGRDTSKTAIERVRVKVKSADNQRRDPDGDIFK